MSRIVRAVLRYLIDGLTLLGRSYVDTTQSPDSGPPPGHPERLVPHLAPTEVELALWAQLRTRPD
jgi:hypothetical protein